ncbi:hypothetical protein [Persicobacter psychrovividus]|uniref:DUF304 domain-containing protein n=1 Tax=Persicobacter psychrovividus TaxID=387638 RepID=A0ABN6LFJ3_9BACT|nr:hypothetical protein PEPS_38940 [Persicobacter psychrovividus]
MRFLHLNSHKVKFLIVFCLSIGFILSEAFYWSIIYNDQIGINIFFNIVACLLFGVMLTLIILPIAYAGWFMKNYPRSKVYNRLSINTLTSNGFRFDKINESTRFHFTEEILKGKVKGFTVILDSSGFRNLSIFLEAEPSRSIGENKIHEIENKLDFMKGALVYGGVSLTYKKDQILTNRTEVLIKNIEDTIRILIPYGVKPYDINTTAHS